MDNHTEQLADGVWRIEVGYYLNTFLLANDGRGDAHGLTLVDTGWRSGGRRLVRSIRMLGLHPRAIERVLLSHWHADHTGSAARLASSSAAPSVHIGEADVAAVTGRDARPLAHADAPTPLGRVFGRVARPGAPVSEVEPLRDGDELDVAGGVRVVAAPGHTDGHSAFLLPEVGVLLAGDAAFNVWFLSRGPKFVCSEVPAVPATIRRLASLEFGQLAVAHGPPVRRRARERLAALVD